MGENVQNQDSTLNFTHNINCYPKIVFDINLFLDYTVQLIYSQHTHILKIDEVTTHTQSLPIWTSSNIETANSQDWRSHHRCFAVDRNVSLAIDKNVAFTESTTSLNSRIFSPTGSRTRKLRCYWGSYNH